MNRPAFKSMMEAAKKHKFKAIIVYRLDRISRNISDFAGLIDELSYLNIAFISIKEQFDTNTPMGRAMMYIASVFSQLERETIAERIRDNMHELAKTGRWLGGTTPTGYESEAIERVTIDGKSKKACKLKLIPEEASIVKLIFDLYVRTGSQTLTETELIKRGIKTKNGKFFTRFSIKCILQNPVYMVADEDAYRYFVKANADLYAKKEEFDGVHGVMAYNRTSQEKGKTARHLPPEEWIVSVGQHLGIIEGKVWVTIQESLERNKSKSYHVPRKNEALLTGLLFCSCGNRMYPKISRGKTAKGKQKYTYVCKMKERSKKTVCAGKNVCGNMIDAEVMEQIKLLAEDKGTFLRELEKSRNICMENALDYGKQLSSLRQEKAELENRMEGLIDSLVDLGDGLARNQVAKRIEQLSMKCSTIDDHISELERLSSQYDLKDMEFHEIKHFLTVFGDGIEKMTIEQKRAVIRSIVQKVIWDGKNVHIFL